MRKQKGFTIVEVVVLVVVVAVIVGWVKNIIKLANCDFEAPYKAEVIHAIGLVPPIGMVTGWLDVGK